MSQLEAVVRRIDGLESEYNRLKTIQQDMARELHECKLEQQHLQQRDEALRVVLRRELAAHMRGKPTAIYLHLVSNMGPLRTETHLNHGMSMLVDETALISGNATETETLFANIQIGLAQLATRAFVQEHPVEAAAQHVTTCVKYLTVTSSYCTWKKYLQNTDVFGVAQDVFLSALLHMMVFSTEFAKTSSALYYCPFVKSDTHARTITPNNMLLEHLKQQTSDMIKAFSSNLLIVETCVPTGPSTFPVFRSAIVCAIGVMYRSEYADDECCDEDMYDPDKHNNMMCNNADRISPVITMCDVPILSFQVPRNMGFSLYLYSVSDTDLCVLTVL